MFYLQNILCLALALSRSFNFEKNFNVELDFNYKYRRRQIETCSSPPRKFHRSMTVISRPIKILIFEKNRPNQNNHS